MLGKRKREDHPDYLKCPLTLDIFRIPVIASDGYTYEKDAIIKHLKYKKTSPMTRQLINENLIPNRTILDAVDEYNQLDPKKKIQKTNTCNQLLDIFYNEKEQIVCYKDGNWLCHLRNYFFAINYNNIPVTSETVKITYPNDFKYNGNMVNGKKEGQGVYILSNGSKYYGEFKNDKMNGNGVMRYPDGATYDGKWKDNTREGYGVYTFPDDYALNDDDKSFFEFANYYGEWNNGNIEGHGVMTCTNGEKLDGEWTIDKRNNRLIIGKVKNFTENHRKEGKIFSVYLKINLNDSA